MSYTRAMIFEMPQSISWTASMKIFRATTQPLLSRFKKDEILKRWSLSQVGAHNGLMILEFENKAAMNKYVKVASAVRREVPVDTGMQSWVYHGRIKASG